MNKCLSNIQCGCRKERSPIDHLVRMENEVRKAFALNEHVISIYFDLEKAYDTTWRVGACSFAFDNICRHSLRLCCGCGPNCVASLGR